MEPTLAPVVVDDEAAQRFAATIGGDHAGSIEYVVTHGRLALIHTEVLPEYEGKGVGSGLVRFAIAEARRRELRVIPTCPFVRSYVESHPETHDIVIGMVPGQPSATR
jgi:predicted GNAT family acetyltransferase